MRVEHSMIKTYNKFETTWVFRPIRICIGHVLNVEIEREGEGERDRRERNHLDFQMEIERKCVCMLKC